MLVLAHKKGERILIGDQIEIVVVETRGDRVRIGIEAPHEISIHREEVWKRIRAENQVPRIHHRPEIDSTTSSLVSQP